MAYISLLWKARTIEKYKDSYEQEKLNSIKLSNAELPKLSVFQKLRHYRYDKQKKAGKWFGKCCPQGSKIGNFVVSLKTDQTFPNFVLKSVIGFVGGIILTYCCFMFFVFQLAISLVHATIMSCIIGVLLTLGLAFSYRIRCLVFLLIPQFFSRVGRYTLSCYALVLVLTGPATNTLRNSEVLSESMACGQEQIKSSVRQLTDSIKKPFNSMKETIKLMIDKVQLVAVKLKETLLKVHRLVLSIVRVLQSAFSWLSSIVGMCNKKVGTPYVRCTRALNDGVLDCQARLGPYFSWLCNVVYVAHVACWAVKPLDVICILVEFVSGTIVATIKRKLRTFSNHVKTMLYVSVHVHHSYSFSSNSSKSASQVAAGIVTEIRHRAEPLLTWLAWSSCVTSLFLLLIIFRAKYYQHMYETRSRFDNRYITFDLRYLDLKRLRENRDTVLPLNRRERAKYITTTSFRLLPTEKLYLARSLVFMCITTFKLLIHMVADYSLYWVLMTIRRHGRFQTPQLPGIPDAGVEVAGKGPVADMMRSLVESLSLPLAAPVPSPVSCLPNPYPPDLQRYTQIGVLIFLLWFLAIFEPYGLRLRHVIMGHYRPERAKARAVWLYNHILRTRGGFLKLARRKLHRDYKYSSEEKFTFRQWLDAHIPCWWLRSLLGTSPKEPHCLLCGTIERINDSDTQLIHCNTPNCPGIYCARCFSDIGQLCTICLSPADYGDVSDISLEKGSSEESSSDNEDSTDTNTKSDTEAEDDKNSDSPDKTSESSGNNLQVDADFNTSSTVEENGDTSKSSEQYKTSNNSHINDSIFKSKKQLGGYNKQNDRIVNFAFNDSNNIPIGNSNCNTGNENQEIKNQNSKGFFKKRKNVHNIFDNLNKLFRCPYLYKLLNVNSNRKKHRMRKLYRKRTRRRKRCKYKDFCVEPDDDNNKKLKSEENPQETVNKNVSDTDLKLKVSIPCDCNKQLNIKTKKKKCKLNELKYMTQDEWIRVHYNKEVGLDIVAKEDDSLFCDTKRELEKIAKKMKKQTKDIITITDKPPQIDNVDWHDAPKLTRCSCPTTSCTCVGQYLQSAGLPLPKMKNIYRGIAKYFISYVYKKKNLPPPSGTFIKELEAAFHQEISEYNKFKDQNILKSRGPEDCLSRCPHFYRTQNLPDEFTQNFNSRNNYVDEKTNKFKKEENGALEDKNNNDSSIEVLEQNKYNGYVIPPKPNNVQGKTQEDLDDNVEKSFTNNVPAGSNIRVKVKYNNHPKKVRKKDECRKIEKELRKLCVSKIPLDKYESSKKLLPKLQVKDEVSFQDLAIDKPLTDGVSLPGSTQSYINSDQMKCNSYKTNISKNKLKSSNELDTILEDKTSRVASLNANNSCSTVCGLKRKLQEFCEWIFGYNTKTEKEVEAKPECITLSSQCSENALDNKNMEHGHSLEMAQNTDNKYESHIQKHWKIKAYNNTRKNNHGIKLDFISEKNRLNTKLSTTEISDSCTSLCTSDWWSPIEEKKKCIENKFKNSIDRKINFETGHKVIL